MSYNQQTIKEAVTEMRERRYILPAIQRKFVWSEKQVIRLFDSLLRGYPIGAFLFWELTKKDANSGKYLFYDFIKDYHERDNYLNPTTSRVTSEKVIAILDGQQRLTALYVALQGSLAMKLPKLWWNNDSAFPKKELYLNILKEGCPDDEENDLLYEFKFLRSDETQESGKNWYKVQDVLDIERVADITGLSRHNNWSDIETTIVSKLWEVICSQKIINNFKVESSSMDEVLDIFVRVNSGGTVLSKSDLLFSTVVSVWKEARDKIDELLELLNKKGNRFNFNTDFIMRTCLYLFDNPIALKLESFKKANIENIKKDWKKISSTIENTVKFLVECGFCDENITTYNAIIPIIYFLYKGGDLAKSKDELRKYLIIAQVKQLFGVASNAALTATRKALWTSDKDSSLKNKTFNLSQFGGIKLTGDRNFSFGAEQLENVFEDNEKNAYTFMILSLLQPELKLGEIQFHQDHLHPYSAFEESKLKKENVNDDDIKNWHHDRNKLANLQLLEGVENKRKKATSLEEWLKLNTPKYMPLNISYSITDFNDFSRERKKLMWNQLCDIFGLPATDKK